MPEDAPKKSKRSRDLSADLPTPDVVVTDDLTPPVVVPPEVVDAVLEPQAKAPKLMPHGKWAGKFGKGYRPDVHDTSKDLTIRHLLGALRANNPTEAMQMEQYITGIFGVKNQAQTGECLAFAMARAATLRCSVLGIPLVEWPSTTGLYTVARAYERAALGFTPENTPLKDEGSIPQYMVQGANEYGIALDSQWPFDPDPAQVNAEPNLEELRDASKGKFPGNYRITSSGAQRVEDVKQAIAAGYPVLIGFRVDPAFEEYMGGIAEPDTVPPIPKAVTAPDLSQDLGGHGNCLFGYQTFANGIVLFRGCNSWGENEWGDHGLFWADVTWLCDDSVMDILVITFDPHSHAVA